MADKDETGQKRMVGNLLSRWVVEAVVIISGFVIPRLLDTHLGRVQLGIWDFGWTAVSYCRFLGFGMAGGLNRFVALNVATDDKAALRATVSSVIALQLCIATLTIAIAAAIALSLGTILPELDPALLTPAKWCIVFLGGTVAIRMLAWPARGILTGQHLWATNSYATLAGDLTALVVMVLVLWFYPGLDTLAFSYMIVTALAESLRYAAARRAHAERLFLPKAVSLRSLKELFVFGIKTNLLGLSQMIVVQTVSIAIAVLTGPAMLALFARAVALQRHSQVVVRAFAEMLTSTSASMQGLGRRNELRQLFVESMRVSFAMTLPIVLLLSFVGNQLITIWMGSDYVEPGLLALLCVGSVVPMSQVAAVRILVGLNEHGRVALRSFVSSIVLLLVCGAIATVVGWTPLVAALVLTICLTLGYGREILAASCRLFNVGFREYVDGILRIPVLINTGLLLLLLLGSWLGMRDTLIGVTLWAVLSGSLTLVAYWLWLLPPKLKERLAVPRLWRRGSEGQGY